MAWNQPIPPPPAIQRPSTSGVSTRQQIIQSSDCAKEVDVVGNYHPKEFLRKLSRELTLLGYNVTYEQGTMNKNPVGHSTGEFIGNIQANAGTFINPAGIVRYKDYTFPLMVTLILLVVGAIIGIFTYGIGFLVLLGLSIYIFLKFQNKWEKTFNYTGNVNATIKAHVSGEIYEDFRKTDYQKSVPMSSNLTAIIGGKVTSMRNSAGPELDKIAYSKGKDYPNPDWGQAYSWWQNKIKADVEVMAKKVEAIRKELTT